MTCWQMKPKSQTFLANHPAYCKQWLCVFSGVRTYQHKAAIASTDAQVQLQARVYQWFGVKTAVSHFIACDVAFVSTAGL